MSTLILHTSPRTTVNVDADVSDYHRRNIAVTVQMAVRNFVVVTKEQRNKRIGNNYNDLQYDRMHNFISYPIY